MTPLSSFTKKIDDVELYCELFASCENESVLRSRFDTNTHRFSEPFDEILVLLHGNGEDGRLFSSVIPKLSENCAVLTIDSRGHGKSTAGNEPFTIDLFAEDLSKLSDELNLGHFSLLGFSDGANVALTYAVRHPERLSHLALFGANLSPEGLRTAFRIRLTLSYFAARKKANRDEAHRLSCELLSLMVNHPHISPRVTANIPCPTLVADGEHDLIKRKHTDEIARSIPHCRRVTVPTSGHNVFADNPACVVAYVNELLHTTDSE